MILLSPSGIGSEDEKELITFHHSKQLKSLRKREKMIRSLRKGRKGTNVDYFRHCIKKIKHSLRIYMRKHWYINKKTFNYARNIKC